MEKSMDTPSKTKNRTTIWFSSLTSRVHNQKRWKLLTQKNTNTPVLIAALFTTARMWKQPKCPSREEWIKMWYIHTMENYSALHWKDWCWNCSSNTLATWYKELTHRKRPWCWVRLKQEKKGTTVDVTVGWHHQLNRLGFEQAPGDAEGQGSLACCSPWGCKDLDTTERLNNNKLLGHRKEWNNAIWSNMDEPRVKQVRQSKTNTIYHLYVES